MKYGKISNEALADAAKHSSAEGIDIKRMADELIVLRKQVADATPVMLTVIALLADEADVAGLREIGLWYEDQEPDHLSIWLDR